MRRSFWARFTVGVSAAALLLLATSCEGGRKNYPTVGGSPPDRGGASPTSCANPREGCACDTEGDEVECGETQSVNSEYRSCAVGTRTCSNGVWGSCAISEVRQQSLQQGMGRKLLAAGTPQVCPGTYDPCDPYCNQVVDVPDNTISTPTGFQVTPSGLTLIETGIGGCTSLTLTPVASKVTTGNVVTVTAFTSATVTTTPTGPVTFTLTATPPTCVTSPFTTNWTTNRPDRAAISGTNNTNGQLTIAIPYAGPIVVTAYAQGLSASTTINVKVNTLDATAAAPNVAATAAQKQAFSSSMVTSDWWKTPLSGTTASSVSWLYPYANTYFPLALPAPIIQYWYTNNGGGGTTAAVASTDRAVKVSLRYPAGASADPAAMNYADFNYSLIAKESNTTSQAAPSSLPEDARDPQITIPQYAWSYFEQTARGNDAEIILQRVRAGILEQESRRIVHPVNGQIKGTIYYSTYNSPQASNTGAILKIAPGATSPTVAVQPSGKCTVCHSLNSTGSYLITNTQSGPGTLMNQSRRYDMSTAGPSPTVLNSYAGSDTVPALGTNTATIQTGTGSAVSITGIASRDGIGLITITTAGVRGTAKFAWTFESQAGSGVTTAASVALGTTGLTANFGTGTSYALGTTYDWGSSQASGSTSGQYWANRLGDRFTFGGPWGDGTLYMTHGGRKTGTVGVGDPNFRAPPDYSSFVSVSNPNSSVPVANWPGDMLAVTPRFNHSGGALVFGYWGGSNLPNASGGLSSLAAGTRLAVADFSVSCTTPPCTGSSAGLTASVSNARNLTPGVTERVAWPSFTPSGDAVVYQRQYRTSKSRTEFADVFQTGAGPAVTLSGTPTATSNGAGLITITTGGARGTAKFSWSLGSLSGTNLTTSSSAVALGTTGLSANFAASPPNYVAGTTYNFDVGVIGTPGWGLWPGWSPSHVNTSSGALAELWLSNVPATSATAATPTRLLALNGLNPDGTSYLPEDTRPASPPSPATHRNAGTSFTISQADACTNTGTATNVYDYRLNYLPAFNPQVAGGYSWVVFTSRRMYGNIAYDDPWDAAPGQSCSSGKPPTKKLWVAALNSSITPGSDPSHPAFYLPGQELSAGNANAEWVNTPCSATGVACASNDDCCGGIGSSPTSSCKVTSAATVPPTRTCQPLSGCSPTGSACTTTADCCAGGTCPSGGGVCLVVTPPIFVQKTYQREYVASCPSGTLPKWRYLEWQATVPTGTSIVFEAQTKATASGSYVPSSPAAPLGTASTTTVAGTWTRSATTVEAAFVNVGLKSLPYLLVSMTFKPNMSGLSAPTLQNWRQIYDCVPSE
ncbi:MAG TPA: hypothetical protein VG937_26175 [Polyangiaceae bacterium]|nr:hypothetical protein [Polyangiaceae bacterium]